MRRYAVAIVRGGVLEVVKERLSGGEALTWIRAHAKLSRGFASPEAAVVLTHPISPAIRRARATSRSA